VPSSDLKGLKRYIYLYICIFVESGNGRRGSYSTVYRNNFGSSPTIGDVCTASPPPLAPFVTDGVRTGWVRYIPRYKQLDTALPKFLDSHT